MLVLDLRLFPRMISTLRLEPTEQIDPWPPRWQKCFDSSSIKRTVDVCCNVASGRFPQKLSINTDMDTDKDMRAVEDSCHCG